MTRIDDLEARRSPSFGDIVTHFEMSTKYKTPFLTIITEYGCIMLVATQKVTKIKTPDFQDPEWKRRKHTFLGGTYPNIASRSASDLGLAYYEFLPPDGEVFKSPKKAFSQAVVFNKVEPFEPIKRVSTR